MNPSHHTLLREIVQAQDVAALGTLHKGQPAVSMVPFALLPDEGRFVIHVSRLATHTKDMLDNPSVSLLVIAPRTPAVSALERPRVSIAGHATPMPAADPAHAAAKAAYLARFPDSAELFGFGDFALFAIEPRSARLVAGFGQAATLPAQDLTQALGPR